MDKKRIVSIVGARPQFIKLAAFSRRFMTYVAAGEHIIIHTGQHYDDAMSQRFFKELEIPQPAVNLGLNHFKETVAIGKMVSGLREIIKRYQADVVILYGDTNTTLAGAIAASECKAVKSYHFESGLRSFNRKMSEENNRIVTDHLCDWLFCPTRTACENLIEEGFDRNRIILGYDLMKDAYDRYYPKRKPFRVTEDFILCTIHRAENTDIFSNLQNVCNIINRVHRKIQVVVSMHPRLLRRLEEFNLRLDCEMIGPTGYLEMLGLIEASKLVMTDSGGLQREAYWAGKKCLVLRNETEWTEILGEKVILTGLKYVTIMETIFDAADAADIAEG